MFFGRAYQSLIWVDDAALAVVDGLARAEAGVYDVVDDEPLQRRQLAATNDAGSSPVGDTGCDNAGGRSRTNVGVPGTWSAAACFAARVSAAVTAGDPICAMIALPFAPASRAAFRMTPFVIQPLFSAPWCAWRWHWSPSRRRRARGRGSGRGPGRRRTPPPR